jgi:aminotransferase
MDRAALTKIADVLRGRDILVITDEIYSELTYGEEKHVSIASLPGMYEKTLYITGFSKAFAMTGWRLGYACGPEDVISAMIKIHQYAVMCAPTTSQFAAVAALRDCDGFVEAMRSDYDARRRVILDGFRGIGLDCFEPMGAFYVFPSIQKTGLSSEEFCRRLLFDQKVAVVPGNAFGACGDGFIRCAYAYSIEHRKIALERIERFLRTL